MDRPGDTFTEFLASLMRHLDDHPVRGGELAAEVFISRSLLDRLISAVAGEPPIRLRRRLLLQRAAFQLRTTDVTVIDAATAAGYNSNESFTRAFQRAYGTPPSAWRTSGGTIHIASPSGVHFYPPGGLRLPARTGVTSMNFAAELIDHHVSVLEQLLDGPACSPTMSLTR